MVNFEIGGQEGAWSGHIGQFDGAKILYTLSLLFTELLIYCMYCVISC